MKKLLIFIVLIAIVFAGCSNKGNTINNQGDKVLAYASFYPLYFLSEEIGGDYVETKIVVPHGVDSHDYEPSMNQLKELSKAQIFIYNGANFESWVDKLIGSIVEEAVTLNASEYSELIAVDGKVDPHLWLNPENMIKVGEAIKDRFIDLDEKNKAYYEANYNKLKNRLKDLDNRFFEELKEKKIDSIIVSHRAFEYMAKRYGFNQIPVAGISPEQEPSPRTIAEIIDVVKEKDHKYIFLETVASPKTVEVISMETNLETLVLNPIEGLTEEEVANGENYITLMERNLENLKKALVK